MLLTRWNIRDRVSLDVMERFYRLLSEGRVPARAPAEAVAAAREARPARFAHPRDRGAFMLLDIRV